MPSSQRPKRVVSIDVSTRPRPRRRKTATVSVVDWTEDEDEILRDGVTREGAKRLRHIASYLPGRTPEACARRWDELQNHGIAVKRPWSAAEDQRMLELVRERGDQQWSVIASYLPGRNSKQCRERWRNQLCPSINKSEWTEEEDRLIVQLQAQFGNAWAQIASQLQGRTDNAVKNRWNSKLFQSVVASLKSRTKKRRSSGRATTSTVAAAGPAVVLAEPVSPPREVTIPSPPPQDTTMVLIPLGPAFDDDEDDPECDVDVFPGFSVGWMASDFGSWPPPPTNVSEWATDNDQDWVESEIEL